MLERNSAQARPQDMLSHVAIDWVVRVEAKDVSDEELNAFGHWLAADPRHRRAYDEADRLWRSLGRSIDREDLDNYRLKKAASAAARAPSRVLPRWGDRRLSAVLGAAAALLLSTLIGMFHYAAPQSTEPLVEHYASGPGDTRPITLNDGTEVTLGAGSAMTANFSDSLRAVALTHGEAFFAVSPDKRRPFLVSAGALKVRVMGTAFDVQRKGRVTLVAVESGEVRVSNPRLLGSANPGSGRSGAGDAIEIEQTLLLRAGERVQATLDQGLGEVGSAEPGTVGAWRHNRLLYRNLPLAAIVADLNRYDSRRIELADAAVGQIDISASFDSRDIDSVLISLTELFPVELRRTPDGRLVFHAR